MHWFDDVKFRVMLLQDQALMSQNRVTMSNGVYRCCNQEISQTILKKAAMIRE
jgi:hypothetical protein